MMIYIAYGSNMSKRQMRYRCPSAKFIGMGHVLGVTLEFYLHATVERSEIKDAYVPVVVWEITKYDEESLDRYEGVPTYYTKELCPVFMDSGETLNGMIYLMKLKRNFLPERRYYDGIREAYEDWMLDPEIKTVLEPALRRAYNRQRKLFKAAK